MQASSSRAYIIYYITNAPTHHHYED